MPREMLLLVPGPEKGLALTHSSYQEFDCSMMIEKQRKILREDEFSQDLREKEDQAAVICT